MTSTVIIQRSWVNPEQDFVQIHVDLAKSVGWVDAAIISRLAFRTSARSREAIAVDGYLWWRAPLTNDDGTGLGDELGLTKSQMQKHLAALVKAGILIREKHRLGTTGTAQGPWDQTYSYRINHGEEPTSAESSMLPIRNMDVADPQHVHVADPQHVPLVEEEVKKRETRAREDHRMFEQFWSTYPLRSSKDAALREWKLARLHHPGETETILIAAQAYAAVCATAVAADEGAKQYIPLPGNWLKSGQWQDETPRPPRSPSKKPPTKRMTPAAKVDEALASLHRRINPTGENHAIT